MKYSEIVIINTHSMRGSESMRTITTIIATIIAKASPSGSVRSGHYICKWLDSIMADDN